MGNSSYTFSGAILHTRFQRQIRMSFRLLYTPAADDTSHLLRAMLRSSQQIPHVSGYASTVSEFLPVTRGFKLACKAAINTPEPVINTSPGAVSFTRTLRFPHTGSSERESGTCGPFLRGQFRPGQDRSNSLLPAHGALPQGTLLLEALNTRPLNYCMFDTEGAKKDTIIAKSNQQKCWKLG
eukprot:Gb_23632 [translate_table: standard]